MKLISLNIEGSKHWKLIDPFLNKEKPDVICLQEAFENDVDRLAARLTMAYAFVPMALRTYDFNDPCSPVLPFGVATLSRKGFDGVKSIDYYTPGISLKKYGGSTRAAKRKTLRQAVLIASIPYKKSAVSIATTHFTWTPDGLPDQFQEKDARALLRILKKTPHIALCGDMNIPRGYNALYDRFIEEYKDMIPQRYRSSMDILRHRGRHTPEVVKNLRKYMVDYLFLKEGYSAREVRLQGGVSDHKAIISTLMLG